MANNLDLITQPATAKLATNEVSQSGELAHVQRVALVTAAGVDMPLVPPFAVNATIVADSVANVAHGAADSGGPNKIGGRAVASVSAQTPVDANDRADMFTGLDSVVITRPDCNLEDIVTGTLVNTDGASTSLIASSGSGIKTYLRSLDLYNSSGAGVVVELKDGTTVKKTFFVPTLGGLIRRFDPPLAGTAATAWNIDAGAATTTLYANAEGFKSKL